MNFENKYCNSLTEYSRFETRVVSIGDTPLGGNYPVRVQSMTTTNTMDTIATVKQTIKIIEAGADYVRITTPSINEAKNLAAIKKELRKRGFNTPLIADVHFTPRAAEIAARIVEKVRINPGNYVDKKRFAIIDYTQAEYEFELERIAQKLKPLINICKEYGTALRIGVNHGSLSDRIMNRFGDTPAGMVESALEFIRICENESFYNLVISMKASNPQIMVQAYRLLAYRMIKTGRNYPLHIGVTEAGDGNDGKIKSAIGIGALLEDGLGDTIRVSLTEPPENEIPVARKIIEFYYNRKNNKKIPPVSKVDFNPFEYNPRISFEVKNIGGKIPPVVVAALDKVNSITPNTLKNIGYAFNNEIDKWEFSDLAPDILFVGNNKTDSTLPNSSKIILNYENWLQLENKENAFPLIKFKNFKKEIADASEMVFVEIELKDMFEESFSFIENKRNIVFVLTSNNSAEYLELRRAFIELKLRSINNPVIIKYISAETDPEKAMLYSSIITGSLLIDGWGNGLWLTFPNVNDNLKDANEIAFAILQATRVRITRTEYIACPSCGRTLFDLVSVTNKIRRKTEHLKGLKIGIMGCIVNGPGEMADADYGYVGSGIGKVSLYRRKEVVKRNIPAESALDELINLIKSDGKWIEEK